MPAENTAASPLAQTAVLLVPSASALQAAVPVLQVPVGVVVPVPAPVPFVGSQKGSAIPAAGGGDVCVVALVTVGVVVAVAVVVIVGAAVAGAVVLVVAGVVAGVVFVVIAVVVFG